MMNKFPPPPEFLLWTHTDQTVFLLIIALVQVCGAFTQNDGFPCLLHLFGSFGRSNLQKALSIFAIIGTEMPHRPYPAGSLSASQLSGQFVKPRHYFFSSKSITSLGWGGGEGSDENKIIFTLPYERMFMSFVGNECKHHRPAEK